MASDGPIWLPNGPQTAQGPNLWDQMAQGPSCGHHRAQGPIYVWARTAKGSIYGPKQPRDRFMSPAPNGPLGDMRDDVEDSMLVAIIQACIVDEDLRKKWNQRLTVLTMI